MDNNNQNKQVVIKTGDKMMIAGGLIAAVATILSVVGNAMNMAGRK